MNKAFYIAGPMRNVENYNYPMFDIAKRTVGLLYPDALIISPADEDREAGLVVETDDGTVTMTERFDIIDTLRHDLNIVLNHTTDIVLLPGWHQSEGARVEAHVAHVMNLKPWKWDHFDRDIIPMADHWIPNTLEGIGR